jgi:hypothetical protein
VMSNRRFALSSIILVLVLLLILIDIFRSNDCAHAHNFGIVAQTKIMGEPSLIFLDLRFDICVFCCGSLRKSTILERGRRKS